MKTIPTWTVHAQRIGLHLYDVFVNTRFYRRVRWDGIKLTKDESVPCGDPIYFPSITELENACSSVR